MTTYLPPEWQDEERIRILMGYMPSPSETAAYKGRLTFWTANLHNWVRYKDGLSFTIKDAQMAFRKGTQVPHCFPEVIQHLIRHGEVVSYDEFNQPGTFSESWSTWSRRVFLTTPSRWAWNKLQESTGNKSLESAVFVDWVILQEVCDKLLGDLFSSLNHDVNLTSILTVESLYAKAKCIVKNLTLDDLNLIIHFLIKGCKADLVTNHDTTYIKLAKPGQLDAPKINSLEIAEHQLLMTDAKLRERMAMIKAEMSPLKEEAQKELLAGSKKHALMVLKRKKRLEKSLEATMAAQENILICMQQVKDSKLNVEMLKVFQMGVNAIKTSISKTGSSEEVAEHMDTLQAVLDDCSDIGESLSFGVKLRGVEDDDETLQKELDDILASSKGEGILLPSVPETEPVFSPEREKHSEARRTAISS